MNVTVNWESVITAAAVISALAVFLKYGRKTATMVEKPNKNEEAIEELRKHHDEDLKEIKGEQTVIVYGLLAALKGLAEKGCDGPVHDAIDKLEKHLNIKAHE